MWPVAIVLNHIKQHTMHDIYIPYYTQNVYYPYQSSVLFLPVRSTE